MVESHRALEEMAGLFATTKLELDSLQDLTRQPEEINSNEQNSNSRQKEGANWVDDSHVFNCQNEACSREFTIKRRKVITFSISKNQND